MLVDEQARTITVHQSDVDSKCSYTYELGKTHKPQKIVGWGALKGTVIHAVIEERLRRHIGLADGDPSERPKQAELMAAIADSLERDGASHEDVWPSSSRREVAASMGAEVAPAFAAWQATVLPIVLRTPQWGRMHLERHLRALVGEVPVLDFSIHGAEARIWDVVMAGTPDVIFSHSLVDWKTTGRMWKGREKVLLQAHFYAHLALENGLVEPYQHDVVPFTYWVWGFDTLSWEPFQVDTTPASRAAAVRKAETWAANYLTGTLPPVVGGEMFGKEGRAWHCSDKWCEQFRNCDAKYLMTDGKEELLFDGLLR